MSETITNDEVVVEESTQQQNEASNQATQLQDAFWGDNQSAPPTQGQEEKPISTDVAEKKEEQPEIVDPNEWIKREFNVDNSDILKEQLKEYQVLKETKPQELKFANEDSKKVFDYLKEGKVDELYSHLQTQKTVNKLLDGEVDERKAAEIIKFNLANKYKEFSEADVERKFNKQYGIPKEPVYDELKETEDEFKVRHDEWADKAAEIKADMLLDAKVIRPELQKFKSELVLPDISTNNQATQRQPTQEELEAFGKQKESFLEATEKFLNEFNGFSTQVKDKDVDYNVSYGTSKEEKEFVKNVAKEFAESGFDTNALFVKDWVNKDGSLNVKQIIEDKMLLANREKVFQKIANDAANQRLEIYLKEKKNIKVDSSGKDFGALDDKKTQSEQLQEKFWNN